MRADLDQVREYGYTAAMKVTVEIPEALYRSVKARAALEGRTIRDLTVELYERWLTPPPPRTEAERLAIAEEWLQGWEEWWDRFNASPKIDSRTARQILMDDRQEWLASPA